MVGFLAEAIGWEEIKTRPVRSWQAGFEGQTVES